MLKHTAALLAFTLLLTACGQKGPLYLPDRNGTVVTSPAANPPGAQPQAPAADGTGQQTAPTQQAPKKDSSDDDSPPPQ